MVQNTICRKKKQSGIWVKARGGSIPAKAEVVPKVSTLPSATESKAMKL